MSSTSASTKYFKFRCNAGLGPVNISHHHPCRPYHIRCKQEPTFPCLFGLALEGHQARRTSRAYAVSRRGSFAAVNDGRDVVRHGGASVSKTEEMEGARRGKRRRLEGNVQMRAEYPGDAGYLHLPSGPWFPCGCVSADDLLRQVSLELLPPCGDMHLPFISTAFPLTDAFLSHATSHVRLAVTLSGPSTASPTHSIDIMAGSRMCM